VEKQWIDDTDQVPISFAKIKLKQMIGLLVWLDADGYNIDINFCSQVLTGYSYIKHCSHRRGGSVASSNSEWWISCFTPGYGMKDRGRSRNIQPECHGFVFWSSIVVSYIDRHPIVHVYSLVVGCICIVKILIYTGGTTYWRATDKGHQTRNTRYLLLMWP